MPRLGLLFGYDWDVAGFDRLRRQASFDHAGFDLFSFPSNARLIGFDLERFAARQAAKGKRRGWQGVVSHNEQFGTLAAALVAERLGLPGATPESVLAAQHKVHARRVLQQVAPEANLPFAELDAEYGGPLPDGLSYPQFVKPVKAAFSVLARSVRNRDELFAHTRFGARELWVIRRLVEPFERIARARLPQAGSAHRMMLEQPVPHHTAQFNLDGWVFGGRTHALGVVAAIMYPGTQAFMRWEFPSRLPDAVQQRALDIARRFLEAIGYRHGFFNMEFFHDPATDRLTVIEFNPRLASQFADLYQRVLGVDAHAMSVAMALGNDPAALPRSVSTAAIAASQVYRVFSPGAAAPMPSARQRAQFSADFPDGLLFTYPKSGHSLARDFKWLGSYRMGIVHLGGRDEADLRERTLRASAVLGWTAPYADQLAPDPTAHLDCDMSVAVVPGTS
ncbi:ATP-grasp domain-containing protein [Piscinibacter sakaiensis]|uniref:ATP-grasp domain-containing protein n=1 Tax=Piscinibacter sakaiensis TaxID=1547922 RepID=UPI003AAF644D